MGTKIRMLPDNRTYVDYYKFAVAFRNGDTPTAFQLAQKIIASWDYTVDLNLKNAIMKLGVAESAEVLRTIMETISKYIEDIDIEEVVVDFAAWDTEKFLNFDEYRRTGRFDKSEPMFKEVVKWDKLTDSTEPVAFSVGATVYKAINEAYKIVVSGKN